VLCCCWFGGRKGIRPVKNMGNDEGRHWLVWMEWHGHVTVQTVAEDISVWWLGPWRFVTFVRSAVYKLSYLLTYPAGWLVCLPLLIFACTIKSRSSLLALAYPGGPRKRAVKWLWWWWLVTMNCRLVYAKFHCDSLTPVEVMRMAKCMIVLRHGVVSF